MLPPFPGISVEIDFTIFPSQHSEINLLIKSCQTSSLGRWKVSLLESRDFRITKVHRYLVLHLVDLFSNEEKQ